MVTLEEVPRGTPIVLFDGICNLCHGTVRFIVKRDSRRRFHFATLQSETASRLLPRFGLKPSDLGSVILIQDGQAWRKSSAALKIAGQLDGLWPVMRVFWLVPRPLRDAIYDFIGNRRYRWFGQRKVCELPDVGDDSTFLH